MFFFSDASGSLAATWQRLDPQDNTIRILGSCTNKKEVTVYLLSATTSDIFYAAGVRCDKGNFNITDELTRWGIPAGLYHLAVGEGQSLPNLNHIEDVSVVYPTFAPSLPPDPNTIFENKAGNVVTSLQAMSDSVNEMITSLDDTTYSSSAKIVLTTLLTSIKASLGGLSEIVVRMQNIIYGVEQVIEQISNSVPSFETDATPPPVENIDTSSATSTSETASSTEPTVQITPENPPEPADPTIEEAPPVEETPVTELTPTTPEALSEPVLSSPVLPEENIAPTVETPPAATQPATEGNSVTEN